MFSCVSLMCDPFALNSWLHYSLASTMLILNLNHLTAIPKHENVYHNCMDRGMQPNWEIWFVHDPMRQSINKKQGTKWIRNLAIWNWMFELYLHLVQCIRVYRIDPQQTLAYRNVYRLHEYQLGVHSLHYIHSRDSDSRKFYGILNVIWFYRSIENDYI